MSDKRTVEETRAKLLRPEKTISVTKSEVTEKQTNEPKKSRYKNKSPGRGGARPGGGRPKGSTNKIKPQDMLDDFEKKAGMSFHEFINEQIVDAHKSGDKELVSKYLLGFAKYLVQDVQEVKQDITSNGETLGVQLVFNPIELPEWNKQ